MGSRTPCNATPGQPRAPRRAAIARPQEANIATTGWGLRPRPTGSPDSLRLASPRRGLPFPLSARVAHADPRRSRAAPESYRAGREPAANAPACPLPCGCAPPREARTDFPRRTDRGLPRRCGRLRRSAHRAVPSLSTGPRDVRCHAGSNPPPVGHSPACDAQTSDRAPTRRKPPPAPTARLARRPARTARPMQRATPRHRVSAAKCRCARVPS